MACYLHCNLSSDKNGSQEYNHRKRGRLPSLGIVFDNTNSDVSITHVSITITEIKITSAHMDWSPTELPSKTSLRAFRWIIPESKISTKCLQHRSRSAASYIRILPRAVGGLAYMFLVSTSLGPCCMEASRHGYKDLHTRLLRGPNRLRRATPRREAILPYLSGRLHQRSDGILQWTRLTTANAMDAQDCYSIWRRRTGGGIFDKRKMNFTTLRFLARENNTLGEKLHREYVSLFLGSSSRIGVL